MSNGFNRGPMAGANKNKGFDRGPMAPATEYEKKGKYPGGTSTGGRSSSSPPVGGPMAPAEQYKRTGRYIRPPPQQQTVYLPQGMSEEQYRSLDTSQVKGVNIVDVQTGGISTPPTYTAEKLIKSNIASDEASAKIRENEQRYRTPFYTLITSRVSATPEVIERAGKRADRVTGFVTRVGVTGFAVGTAGAALAFPILPAAPAGAGLLAKATVAASPFAKAGLIGGSIAKIGLTGTAAKVAIAGSGIGVSILSPKIAEETYKTSFMFTNPSEYKLIRDPLFQQAVDYGKGQYYGSISDSSIDNTFKNIGGWIPGLRQGLQGGGVKSGVTEFYLNMGYSKAQAKRLGELAFETNIAQGFGDVVGTVGLETSSEIFGRKMSENLFRRLSSSGFSMKKRITLSAAGALVPAGFLEGSSEYVKERIMENQPVKLFETYKLGPVTLPGGILGSGAFGSVFATGLGTTIARTSLTRPKTSSRLLTAARIIDPFEYPGDVLGGAIMQGKIRFPRKVYGFTPVGIASNPNQIIENIINAGGKGSKSPIINPSTILSSTPSTTSSTSPMPLITPIPVTPTTPTPVPTPTAITPIIDVPSNVPSIIDIEIPTEVPTSIPASTPVSMSTQAPASIPSTVPIASPLLRLPFIPLHGGGGRGSKGFRGFRLGKGYSFKEFKVPDLDKIIGKNLLGGGYKPPVLKKLLGGIKI